MHLGKRPFEVLDQIGEAPLYRALPGDRPGAGRTDRSSTRWATRPRTCSCTRAAETARGSWSCTTRRWSFFHYEGSRPDLGGAGRLPAGAAGHATPTAPRSRAPLSRLVGRTRGDGPRADRRRARHEPDVVALAGAVIVHSRKALGRLGPPAAGRRSWCRTGPTRLGRDRPTARRPGPARPAGRRAGPRAFGIVHPSKLNAEAIEAFAAVAAGRAGVGLPGRRRGGRRRPGAAAGRGARAGRPGPVPRPAGRRRVPRPGRRDRPGRRPPPAADPRRDVRGPAPPAALGRGRGRDRPGSFADTPRSSARCRGRTRGALDGARRAPARPGRRPRRAQALAARAVEHVRAHHAWPLVAARYAEVIERARASGAGRRPTGYRGPPPPRGATGPHRPRASPSEVR